MEKKEEVMPTAFIQVCPYEQRTGNCLAKLVCGFKHELNTNAVVFKPGRKKVEAEPTKPAPDYSQEPAPDYYPPKYHNAFYEEEQEGLDDVERQTEFFEECKDCACCHGYIYSCNGEVCKELGMCHCKFTQEVESSS